MTRRIAILVGLYAFLGGIISLSGWVFDIPLLTDWNYSGISIQPNATLCVIFSGLAVLALIAHRLRIVLICGATVLFISGLTLVEWLSGLSFGMDAVLMFGREWGRVGVVYPGRMGPPGSFSWTLIGLALLLTSGPLRLRWLPPALALVTAAVSGLSLVGFLYGVDELYTVPHITVIALQTSTFIMAVSIGIIVSHPEHEPMRLLLDQGGAGIIARRALPLMLLVPIIMGFLRVRGQAAGLYDTGMGSALTSVVLIIYLATVMWWVLKAVQEREQKLKESEERFRLMVESARDYAIFSLDLSGSITGWNTGAENLLGYSEAEILGQDAELMYTPEDRKSRVPQKEREKAREEGRAEDERWHVRKDGSRFWASGLIMSMWHGDMQIGFVKIMRNRTEARQAEEKLREADRRKDEFLATLAHELRNPLAPVRNAVQILHLKGPALPELQWARDVIDRQMQQMTRLIDDLMDVSRISQGKIELKREKVSLSAVIQGAVETSRPLIEKSGHDLTVNLPPHPVYLDADETRLAQVFANLLNNAAKYTERGGAIRLMAERQGSDIVVTVQDSGIGIPREKLRSVFEMFSQVEGALNRSQGGLGIGLSLVKRLVEMHEGTIEAHSQGPGKGSEFVVRLPLIVEHPIAASYPVSNEQEVSKMSLKILIVDDNRDGADSLEMMLQMTGNTTRTAYDGEEAVRAAEEFQPQVMLLDIGLPKINGYQVCRFIRQEPWGKNMVIIAVTGWGQDEDKQQAQEAGFDHHLVKPVDPPGLIQLLGSLAVV